MIVTTTISICIPENTLLANCQCTAVTSSYTRLCNPALNFEDKILEK